MLQSFILLLALVVFPVFCFAGSDSSSSVGDLGSDLATDMYTHGGTVDTESGDVDLSGGEIVSVTTLSGDGYSMTVQDDLVAFGDVDVDGDASSESAQISGIAEVGSAITNRISAVGSVRILDDVDASMGTFSNVKQITLQELTPSAGNILSSKKYVDDLVEQAKEWGDENIAVEKTGYLCQDDNILYKYSDVCRAKCGTHQRRATVVYVTPNLDGVFSSGSSSPEEAAASAMEAFGDEWKSTKAYGGMYFDPRTLTMEPVLDANWAYGYDQINYDMFCVSSIQCQSDGSFILGEGTNPEANPYIVGDNYWEICPDHCTRAAPASGYYTHCPYMKSRSDAQKASGPSSILQYKGSIFGVFGNTPSSGVTTYYNGAWGGYNSCYNPSSPKADSTYPNIYIPRPYNAYPRCNNPFPYQYNVLNSDRGQAQSKYPAYYNRWLAAEDVSTADLMDMSITADGYPLFYVNSPFASGWTYNSFSTPLLWQVWRPNDFSGREIRLTSKTAPYLASYFNFEIPGASYPGSDVSPWPRTSGFFTKGNPITSNGGTVIGWEAACVGTSGGSCTSGEPGVYNDGYPYYYVSGIWVDTAGGGGVDYYTSKGIYVYFYTVESENANCNYGTYAGGEYTDFDEEYPESEMYELKTFTATVGEKWITVWKRWLSQLGEGDITSTYQFEAYPYASLIKNKDLSPSAMIDYRTGSTSSATTTIYIYKVDSSGSSSYYSHRNIEMVVGKNINVSGISISEANDAIEVDLDILQGVKTFCPAGTTYNSEKSYLYFTIATYGVSGGGSIYCNVN